MISGFSVLISCDSDSCVSFLWDSCLCSVETVGTNETVIFLAIGRKEEKEANLIKNTCTVQSYEIYSHEDKYISNVKDSLASASRK